MLWARALLAVAMLLPLAWLPAARQLFDRPLTDDDIRKLVPLLRIDADAADRARAEAERKAAADKARDAARKIVLDRIAAGGLDPLEWLREQSPNAAAPSTARYDAACSKETCAALRDVTAVFTFGLAAPASWLAVAGATGMRTAVPPPGAAAARAPSAETITQQTRAFYSARGFESQGTPAPFQWVFLSPDEIVTASVHGVKPATDTPSCSTLASGPAVVLAPGPKAFATPPPAASKSPAAARPTLTGAVAGAGLTDAAYQSLKFQVTIARQDARDPARLEARNDVAAAAPQAEGERAIRKQNAETYKRFAAELDPLLDRLER